MTSCRDCKHFHPDKRMACEFYERCRARRALKEAPPFFRKK